MLRGGGKRALHLLLSLEKRRWREVEEEGRLLSEQKSEEKGTSLKEEGVVRRRSWLSIRGGQRHSITIVIWS